MASVPDDPIAPHPAPEDRPVLRWRARVAVAVIVALAIATVAITNRLLTERFTQATRNGADIRIAMYSGNVMAELRKSRVVPLLLSQDPELVGSLAREEYALTSQRLLSYVEDIGADSLMLLDSTGRTVAATDRSRIGEQHRQDPYFVDALRSSDTVFTRLGQPHGPSSFFYSRKIVQNRQTLGVVVVGIDLRQFEDDWAATADAVMMFDSRGEVILATEPRWLGLTEAEALDTLSAPTAIDRAIALAADLMPLASEDDGGGEGVIRTETGVPFFQGWRLAVFTPYSEVRERVNAVLALEIMVFAVLLALTFYLASRKASLRLRLFQRESAELRRLNDRLSREIAERERAQADLSAAEATLEQSSKLAVLGEMSASVSHELNQPLAAMKTYLAGARLLLQRRRHEEAMSSFQRIDDLIERMGAITRQLKSYARKGGEAFEPVDLRAAASSALAMMEPQLKARSVTITRTMPSHPVMVTADRLRLEQVIINLLRNALDATQGVSDPRVDLLLAAGRSATLSVRDNGHGIEDLDSLFEPFYTTKAPGDGVGLGLAISSGIVSDLGGRLTARNGRDRGAVFEVRLPLLGEGRDGGAPRTEATATRGAPPSAGGGAAVAEAAE